MRQVTEHVCMSISSSTKPTNDHIYYIRHPPRKQDAYEEIQKRVIWYRYRSALTHPAKRGESSPSSPPTTRTAHARYTQRSCQSAAADLSPPTLHNPPPRRHLSKSCIQSWAAKHIVSWRGPQTIRSWRLVPSASRFTAFTRID